MEYEDRDWYILYNALPNLVDLIDDLECLLEPEITRPLDLIREAESLLRAFLKSKEPNGVKAEILL